MRLSQALSIMRRLEKLTPKDGKGRRWCPHEPTGKQQAFLEVGCLEALYGGAAGGGKSDALLMSALQYVDVPTYSAILLRRTYTDLALPGAIMDRAEHWLRGTDARWSGQDKRWTFPSGARLTFGYLEAEADKFRYQSSEFQFIGFDELTQFSDTQYTYLLSRLRRCVGVDVPLRARSASNPGGVGHDWVFSRFVDPETRGENEFVPARLDDNPHIDQPAYRESLSRLDKTTNDQLEKGLWVKDAHGLALTYNDKENGIDAMPAGRHLYIFVLDLGASEVKPTTAFSVTAFSWDEPYVYLVESEKLAMGAPYKIAAHIKKTYLPRYKFMAMVIDKGGLGPGYATEFNDRHRLPFEGADKENKLGHRRLLRGEMERGTYKVVRGANKAAIKEMGKVRMNDAGTDVEPGAEDHLLDTMLYGYRKALAYLHEDKPPGPKPGSAEALDAEMDAMADVHDEEEGRKWPMKR